MSNVAATKVLAEIRPAQVRYIKLGEAGKWEKECIEKGIVRYGFGSASADRFPLCQAGKWDELAKSFLAAGKTKGTATRNTNETRLFFEDHGATLWITFVGERLYWGLLNKDTPPERHSDGDGVWRIVAGGWRCADVNGEALTKDRLSGALTKLASYRGTSCGVDVANYVIRRINGQKTPEVERAVARLEGVTRSAQELMKLLEPRDFETLVDLVFSTSGWRRLGIVGKTQKTLDLDIVLPSTGERAFVQVKSKTTSAELAQYVGNCHVSMRSRAQRTSTAWRSTNLVTGLGTSRVLTVTCATGSANAPMQRRNWWPSYARLSCAPNFPLMETYATRLHRLLDRPAKGR